MKKTEVEKLVFALKSGAKTKEELELVLSLKSVVKHVVNRARNQGFKITYQSGTYTLHELSP